MLQAFVKLTEEMLSGEEQTAHLEVQEEAGREGDEGRKAAAEAFNNPSVTSATVEFGQGDASAQLRRYCSKNDQPIVIDLFVSGY